MSSKSWINAKQFQLCKCYATIWATPMWLLERSSNCPCTYLFQNGSHQAETSVTVQSQDVLTLTGASASKSNVSSSPIPKSVQLKLSRNAILISFIVKRCYYYHGQISHLNLRQDGALFCSSLHIQQLSLPQNTPGRNQQTNTCRLWICKFG